MRILQSKTWLGSFPLRPLQEKLDELKSAEGKRRILVLAKFRVSLYTVLTTYTWIHFVLVRIDNDLYANLEFFRKLQLVFQGARVTADELPPSNAFLTSIDIISLVIFLNILMDDVVRFLHFLFWGGLGPKTENFYEFRKTISNFEGQRLEGLNRIIVGADWYEELKNLRDKPIVHHGDRDSGIGMRGGTIGIHLRHIQDKAIKETFLSNQKIDAMCENVRRFLEDLNVYLCDNFDHLPLEAKRKEN